MSFVNIPVMGSAQDLRRQLRYSTSRPKRGPVYNHNNQITDNLGSIAVASTARKLKTASSPGRPTLTRTTGINPASTSASFSFPNLSNKVIGLPRSNMSSSSRARVPATNSQVSYSRTSKPYVPPPPARRNYQTRDGDRASYHSNSNSHHYSTLPRSSSVARSTSNTVRTSRQHQTTVNPTARGRSRSRAPSPYRNLTLPDEPETTLNFPNSDPNLVTQTVIPVPSGYVNNHSGSKARASSSRDVAGPQSRTSTAKSRPASGHPRSTSRVAPSTTSRNVAPQHPQHVQPRRHPQSSSRTSRAPSRIPFIPPNPGEYPDPVGSKPLVRSPSRNKLPPPNAESSPSTATGESNAGPRTREGHPLPGLTARTESPEPQLRSSSRNVSRNGAGRTTSISRGRSLQQDTYPTRGVYSNQARHHGHSPARSASHPSLAAGVLTPAPIPIPTPITYPQTLAAVPGKVPSRNGGIPFPSVGKIRLKQLGNYIPQYNPFRQNRAGIRAGDQSQGSRLGQDAYTTRPVASSRIPNGSTLQNHINDSSSPAVIARSSSRRKNPSPNQRNRSGSRQSRHSQRSQQPSSHHSHANRSIRDTRAPVRVEGDQAAANRSRNNKLFKWKWPTNRFGTRENLPMRENGDITLGNIPNGGTVEVIQDGQKRVRTISNLSANWHLPQIKNFTVLKARVHDSPNHHVLPYRPALHPLLRTATLFRPARLHWDVRHQALPAMSAADTIAMQRLLKEPATSPPTTRMRLLLRSPAPRRQRNQNGSVNPKYWEVDVIPSSSPSQNHPNPYIKCMDVIRTFGKMLRTPADPSEFDSLDMMHQRLAVRVFEMRAAGLFGGTQVTDSAELERVKAREIRKGYRKVDLLVNQTRWDGLQSTGTETNEWIVKLGRVPLNPF